MLLLSRSFALAALLAAAAVHAQPLDYGHQDQWKAVHDAAESPINIETAKIHAGDARESQRIHILHPKAEMEVVDNGHAIEVESKGPEAVIRGRHFKLAQFHFHATSEHTIDGKFFPMEGHFVFSAADGRVAVIGVMYRQGAANALAAKILEQIDKKPSHKAFSASISALLPHDMAYYHYLGSLTTPPLTENVEWYVLRQPVTLSDEQIEAFKARYSHNNRSVQPLNERPIVTYPAPR
ncbi:MAG: carbonic anhydrase family protein [Burkholderiaceae bacterium]|nr:carbonic anhydrase family protein [Burkholderiaceae bacterium]